MGLEPLLKRALSAAPATLIAVAAYWQVRGCSALLSAHWLASHEMPATHEAGVSASVREIRSAAAILAHNPFDTTTVLVPQPTEPQAPPPIGDPLRAPKCDQVHVYVTTEFSDPRASLAVVQGPGDTHGVVRRVGDRIGDRTIAFIGRNPLEDGPAVWMYSHHEGLCQTLLFGGLPRQQSQPQKPALVRRPPLGPVTPRAASLPPQLAARIRQLNPGSFQVERSAVDQIMTQYAQLLHGVRTLPEQKNGRVVGLRILNVTPSTLLDRLGIRNGDRIERINGFSLASPAQALEAYARLRTASRIVVQLDRAGSPTTLEYRLR